MGISYAQLGRLDEVLESMLQSLAYLDDDETDEEAKFTTYNNIALVLAYGKLGNFDLALEYEKKSLALSRAAQNLMGELSILDNFGSIFF
jgi:tetratricopeptide (TPR) repeat protein